MTYRHRKTGWVGEIVEESDTHVLLVCGGWQWSGDWEQFEREWVAVE